MAVHALVDGVRQILKSGGHATLAPAMLHGVGVELFYLWLHPFWPHIEAVIRHRRLVAFTVITDIPEIVNLPWALLQWPHGAVLGLDQQVALRLRARPDVATAVQVPVHLSQGACQGAPWKVLFMHATPAEFCDTCDTADGAMDVALRSYAARHHRDTLSCAVVPDSTADALKRSLSRFRPHILFLTGPVFIRGEQGFFGFADRARQADVLSATEMVRDIFGCHPPGMVVVVGRGVGRSPPVAATGAVCQTLVLRGVSRALAWPSRAGDAFMIDFFRAFLHDVAGGVTWDHAVQRARCAIQPACATVGDPVWVLPALYAHAAVVA